MEKDFDVLSDVIKKHSDGRNLYYVANPGNWGDALIRQGTLKFFRDYNIDVKELRLSKTDWIKPVIKGGVVLFGGGGGWCNNWNMVVDKVQFLSKRFNVIILPSTFEKTYSIPNTIFFRRDNFESKENMPESYFCHDMAYYLGSIDFKEGSGTGNFFRTDKESRGIIEIPGDNYDISAHGTHFSEGITLFRRDHIIQRSCKIFNYTHRQTTYFYCCLFSK